MENSRSGLRKGIRRLFLAEKFKREILMAGKILELYLENKSLAMHVQSIPSGLERLAKTSPAKTLSYEEICMTGLVAYRSILNDAGTLLKKEKSTTNIANVLPSLDTDGKEWTIPGVSLTPQQLSAMYGKEGLTLGKLGNLIMTYADAIHTLINEYDHSGASRPRTLGKARFLDGITLP